MSTLKKVALATLATLVSLAMAATALFRYRAAGADKKVRAMEIADGANAEKQQARLQELARVKQQIEALPGKSITRTDAEVTAELRRRGLLK